MIDRTPLLAAGLAALLASAGAPCAVAAHEIPASVLVQAYVKPEGNRLHVLLRVPLESMRDIEFPLRAGGYLELERLEPLLRTAAHTWLVDYIDVREDGRSAGAPVIAAVRVSLPSDASFASWTKAYAHVHGEPLAPGTLLYWQHALLDVLLEYRVAADRSRFAIAPALAHLGIRTTTVLRFLPPDGRERVLQYAGDPGLVRLDPRWHQSAWLFARLGFFHILDGIDHLLFLLCLVIPFRRLRPLVVIVTSFTVAHSITLMSAALGFAPDALWFPPVIEVLIAASILWMAFENIVGPRLDRRWLVAFGFGLIHGFGFSFLLTESLQFAGSHLAMSLLAFNAGVEVGQIAVLLVAVPCLGLLFRRVPERVGGILLSALVAHTAWHWMADRWADARQYSFELPALDLLLVAAAMRWLMLALIAGGAVWLLRGAFARWLPPSPAPVPTAPEV